MADLSNKLIFISIPSSELLQTGDGQKFCETEKAYGFQFSSVPTIVWIPKSRIQDFALNFDNHSIEFWIPSWLVTNKSLEVYKSTAYEQTLF